jgi:tRNA(Ile)-lysidine synthase
MTSDSPAPDARLLREAAELGLVPGSITVVALSGGLDSVVLLHLLRFTAGHAGARVVAAHFDHRMRSGSEADARWVAGLCRAWEVRLFSRAADGPLSGEDEARRARYRFLQEVRAEAGAALIATAHHADDQAETVLFRVLRGTGLSGLGGIAPRSDGLVRPLLGFWRSELRAYARREGLRWRADPTNLTLVPARNRIRHRILPEAERHVAAGARRSLVRLAALAREDEAAWAAALEPLVSRVLARDGEALLLARKPLQTYHPAVAARIVRHALLRFGLAPSRAGTRAALQFITGAESGRVLMLPGGVRLRSEFGRVRVEREVPAPPVDRSLTLAPQSPGGSGELRLGGRRVRAAWRVVPWRPDHPRTPHSVALRVEALEAPLVLRARLPGDRIRLPGGSRSLKRLLIDRRIPAGERPRLPVLVSGSGAVLWVAGVAAALDTSPREGELALILTLDDVRS